MVGRNWMKREQHRKEYAYDRHRQHRLHCSPTLAATVRPIPLTSLFLLYLLMAFKVAYDGF